MDVQTARQLARDGALQADSTSYDNTKVDLALLYVGNDFMEHCQLDQTQGTVALNATAITFTSTSLADFRPERLIRAELSDYSQVEHRGYLDVINWLNTYGTSGSGTSGTAAPTMVAWRTVTDGLVNVTPGTAYTALNITYFKPFTSWTAGGSGTVATLTINIPDRYAYAVFHDGAASVLQMNDGRALSQSLGWQRYMQHRDMVAGLSGVDRGIHVASEQDYL